MSTDRIRTTISLSPEVLEIFKRMADGSNTSVSRCMGDWLENTAEAAEMITLKVEEARRAPMRAVQEMLALVGGIPGTGDESGEYGVSKRRRGREGGAAAPPSGPAAARSALEPPSSNTGVLVPPGPGKPRGVKSLKSGLSGGRK